MATNNQTNSTEGSKSQFTQAASIGDATITQNNKHQPGKLVGNDTVPEFSAQTLPPGSAPADRTFQPNPTDEAPLVAGNPSAQDTIQGATSADVHTGLGHPGAGQSSKELRHDGETKRNAQGLGLEGLKSTPQGTVDSRDQGFAKNDAVFGNVDKADAQDREGESAEQLAGERA